MKYNRLHINHFGKLQNRTLEFSDGINVIYGPNESGKSTLHAFLESMQFGMERGRGRAAAQDLYSRYYPETGSSTYGGVLEFTQNDTTYSIYRNFKRDPLGYTLMDEQAGRQLTLTEEEYHHLLCDMTLPLYRNTVSLRQLQSATSKDFPEQLRNHIINLRTSGSASLDLTAAKARLKKERKALEQEYSKEVEARSAQLRQELISCQEERSHFPDGSELPKWEKERKRLQNEAEALKDRHVALTQAIHNDETYLEEHSKGSEYSIQEAENRCQRLLARREKLLKEYPEPNSGPFRNLYPAITAGSAILAILSAIFAISSFAGGKAVPGVLSILSILCMVLAFRYGLTHFQAQRAFRYVDSALKELYQQTLPQTPNQIDQQSLQDFLNLMEELKNRKKHLQRCRKEMESITGRLFQLQEQQERITQSLELKKKDFWRKTQLDEQIGQLEVELEGLSPQLLRNRELLDDMAAIDLAVSTMDELAVTAFDSFGSYLQKTSSRLINQITGGRYQRLLIDDDLNILLEQDHQPVELRSLSCSTLDQVYLSLRIACIDFFWPRDTVPILLDESFAMYDSERIAETLSWLAECYPGQIFLFTCQHREEEIMKKAGITYHTIAL